MTVGHTLLILVLCLWTETGLCQCPHNGVGFYSHPQQCDAYYECRNGTVIETLCPDGLVFNERASIHSGRCEYPSEVDCSQKPVLQQARPTSHCPHRWGLFPHENDCGRFWNCVDGTPYAFQCPEGLAFNELRNHCDWADQVDRCDSEVMMGFQCPQPGPNYYSQNELSYYAHPSDCRKHFVCLFGTDNRLQPRMFNCDEGQVYNAETSSCDKPANVPGCENYYGRLYSDDIEDPNAVEPNPIPRRRKPNSK